MHTGWIIILAAACLLTAGAEVLRRRRLSPWYARGCAGRAWKKRFPDATATEIRRFLSVFADGFLLKKRHRLKFFPDDSINEIYKAIYPFGGPDAMEYEILFLELDKLYNREIPVESFNERLTLGELFSAARASSDKK
ncbi:MAG: hypothetical protein LBC18_14135 [Opitutaceae bacterium]|jgi:hypothetical protein|nr:hypothetical protein [Opitutaceae bacterium]